MRQFRRPLVFSVAALVLVAACCGCTPQERVCRGGLVAGIGSIFVLLDPSPQVETVLAGLVCMGIGGADIHGALKAVNEMPAGVPGTDTLARATGCPELRVSPNGVALTYRF